LLIGERLDFELVKDHDAEEVVSSEHGHPEFCSDGINVSQRVAVLSICLEVGHMDRPSLECNSGGDAVSPRRYGMPPDEIDELRRGVVERHSVV
jgi:hypothetical protein